MGLNDVPDGWQLKKLGDVCVINPSRAEVRGYPDDLDVTFVPMAAVSEAGGAIDSPDIRKLVQVRKGYTYFREGDVLFAKITPCMENGKAGVARGLLNGLGFGSTEFHVLRPLDSVLPEWVFYWIRRPSFREQAAASFTGSVGQQRVPQWFLSEHDIPVPPLEEQRRVVGRIEELARHIEAAKDLRRAARQEAEALLPAAIDDIFNNKLGDRCAKKAIGDLAFVQSGYAFKSAWFCDDGVRLLRNANVSHGTIDWSNMVYLPWERAADFARFELHEGDVILSLDRPLISTGLKLARLASGDVPSLLVQRVGRLVLLDSSLLPAFLYYFLLSSQFRESITGPGRSIAVPHISPAQVQDMPVPLPSLDEQRRIVAHLDSVQAKAQALLRLQEETQRELDALLASVLDRAFRGELLTEPIVVHTNVGKTAAVPRVRAKRRASRQFQDAAVYAMLVSELTKRRTTPSRFRVVKHFYFLRRRAGEAPNADFAKYAAGPYDPRLRYRGPEGIAVRQHQWLTVDRKGVFAPGPNIDEGLRYARNYTDPAGLDWVLSHFATYGDSALERWATVDYAAHELARQGNSVSANTVMEYLEADPIWRNKLRRPGFAVDDIDRTLQGLRACGLLEKRT